MSALGTETVLRQEDKTQTLKHLETKRRLQKILVTKMLRLERKQILGGSFLPEFKKSRVDSCESQFACDRTKGNAARELSKTLIKELTEPKGSLYRD